MHLYMQLYSYTSIVKLASDEDLIFGFWSELAKTKMTVNKDLIELKSFFVCKTYETYS